MGNINWSDVLGSVLPTIVILGAGWIKTHGKVKEVLDLVRQVADQTDDAANGK